MEEQIKQLEQRVNQLEQAFAQRMGGAITLTPVTKANLTSKFVKAQAAKNKKLSAVNKR